LDSCEPAPGKLVGVNVPFQHKYMAISGTKGQGWKAVPTQYRKWSAHYEPQPWPPFYSAATQKGKGIKRLI